MRLWLLITFYDCLPSVLAPPHPVADPLAAPCGFLYVLDLLFDLHAKYSNFICILHNNLILFVLLHSLEAAGQAEGGGNCVCGCVGSGRGHRSSQLPLLFALWLMAPRWGPLIVLSALAYQLGPMHCMRLWGTLSAGHAHTPYTQHNAYTHMCVCLCFGVFILTVYLPYILGKIPCSSWIEHAGWDWYSNWLNNLNR